MSSSRPILEFIHETRFADLPAGVVAMAERCCLDTLGVAVAGRMTDLSRIITNYAERFHAAVGTDQSDILFSGRMANPVGAALAGGMSIDSFDAHDGHRLTKGHAGAAVIPGLLALCSSLARGGRIISGREFLATLVIGYEVSLRAGIALHGTASDYHTSGSWNALGVAAMAARLLRFDTEVTRHALGIAEFYGPRSQMMRCIDHPTMVKDGSGWGALSGASAAWLAADGFTGAPALLIEGEAEAAFWRDLGTRWEITHQYLKPHPVCRWAHPAMDAVEALIATHRIRRGDIEAIEIHTFAEAVRLGTRPPHTTEEAQYAMGFPVAAMAVRGAVGAAELGQDGLRDPAINALLGRIRLIEDTGFSARFPAERLAIVTVTLRSGQRLTSAPTGARGDPEVPLDDDEVGAKFHRLADGSHPQMRAVITESIAALDTDEGALFVLAEAILAPPA